MKSQAEILGMQTSNKGPTKNESLKSKYFTLSH